MAPTVENLGAMIADLEEHEQEALWRHVADLRWIRENIAPHDYPR